MLASLPLIASNPGNGDNAGQVVDDGGRGRARRAGSIDQLHAVSEAPAVVLVSRTFRFRSYHSLPFNGLPGATSVTAVAAVPAADSYWNSSSPLP